jgi:hypothetical protein
MVKTTDGIQFTPFQQDLLRRGFPVCVLDYVDKFGNRIGHKVRAPKMRELVGDNWWRAFHLRYRLHGAQQEPVDDWLDRFERAADCESELLDTEAVATVYEAVNAERRLTPHFMNRLYGILDYIMLGFTGPKLKEAVGRVKEGALPSLETLTILFRFARRLDE